jgi:Methylaspartate ammonia-lyase N-terminus
MLLLDDGQVAFGDCTDVILAGVAGRDPLFQAEQHLEFLCTVMRELLRGRPVDRFRNLAEEVDRLVHDGRRLHTALRYGITQALLHAAALSNRCTMAEIVSRAYDCAIATAPIPRSCAASPIWRNPFRKICFLPGSGPLSASRAPARSAALSRLRASHRFCRRIAHRDVPQSNSG